MFFFIQRWQGQDGRRYCYGVWQERLPILRKLDWEICLSNVAFRFWIVVVDTFYDRNLSGSYFIQRSKIHVKKLNRKMLERPKICYIFEKLSVQGCQIWHSHVSMPFNSAPAHSTRPHNAKKSSLRYHFSRNSWKFGSQKLLPQAVKVMWQQIF